MPAKKKANVPPPRKVVKAHFFVHPARQEFEEIVPVGNIEEKNEKPSASFPQFEKRRYFVYNKETGEPYAEWIDNVAVSLETGEELFRSSRSFGDSYEDTHYARRFNFSVPTFYRADDPTIYTETLVEWGIVTEKDISEGNGGLSKEKYMEWKRMKADAQSALP
jgi:hypothetical protein